MLLFSTNQERLSWGVVLVAQSLLATNVFARLASPTLKHVFSICITLILHSFMLSFGGQLQILGIAIACFYLTKFNHQAYWTPVVVTFLSLTALSINHIVLQLVFAPDASSLAVINYSVPMMTAVMKIISFSWSVYDAHAHAAPSLYQKCRAIDFATDAGPSLLEFLGYISFFPSSFVGPFFDFSTYRECMQRQEASAVQAYVPAVKAAAKIVVPLLILAKWGPAYELTTLLALPASHFGVYSLVHRLVLLALCGFMIRLGNYIWSRLAEGACIAAGLELKNQNYEETGVNDFLITFWHPSAVGLDAAHSQNVWLKHNIYDRLVDAGISKSSAVLSSYLIVALWHGVHFGFYFSLASLLLVHSLKELIWKRWALLLRKSVYYPLLHIFGIIVLQISINVSVPAMIVRSLFQTVQVYSPLFVSFHLLALTILLTSYL
ncbi:lysophospholipid acyltransferase [Kappamyces sp. JEL0680]|nr:lysophospholipid acyltransferase [Kappamyces sp. JEL0680]